MKEKIKSIVFSNKKSVIAIWVILLTLSTIGISYSAFFTVKTNTNNQTITTGNLSVAYGGLSSSITRIDMQPLSDEEGMNQDGSSVIHVQNNGNLDANYVLTIGYDVANFTSRSDYNTKDVLTPLDFIKFAVYEYNATESTLIAGPLSMADLPVYKIDTNDNRKNRYAVLFGSLGAISNTTKTYQVKMWLSDKATASVSSSYFYVNSEIIAEAENTKMAYNINGYLKNTSGNALANATISFQNNSIRTTTDATGAFELPQVLPGTYNIDINYNNKTYEGNLTVKEGSNISITNVGSAFVASNNLNLATAAYTYGTTISKLMRKNEIDSNSTVFTFKGGNAYQLEPSYILTGANHPEINDLTITINDTTITNFTLS